MDMKHFGEEFLMLPRFKGPDKIDLEYIKDSVAYSIKAFYATNTMMVVDDCSYFPKVMDGLVVSIRVRECAGYITEKVFTFHESPTGGWISDCPRTYERSLPEEYQQAFTKLFSYYRKIAGVLE